MKKIIKYTFALVLISIFIFSPTTVIFASTNNTISLNKSSVELAVVNNSKINNKIYNNTYQLKATISKSLANKKVVWSSNNKYKVSVDQNGKITAKAAGTATITAKASNGKIATCKVKVVLNTNKNHNGRFNEHVKYSTVWPICNKDIYSNSNLNQKIGNINALTECIIVETNGVSNADYFKFKIKTADGKKVGWVDTENLLINLPDVRSDIIYNISNATTNTLFKIGSEDKNISQVKAKTQYTKGSVKLPDITGKKIYTYDSYDTNRNDGKVWNSKLEKAEFVCPVLYKFALKVGEAQNIAVQNGYYLKIYDGYRPQNVCDIFWDRGLQAIGANMKNGKSIYINGYASMKSYQSRTSSEKKATCLTGGYWTESLYNKEIPTVYVNGNPMNISWFIASNRSTSDHARGTAVDLTMVYKSNKNKEILTQSSMHDLSLNSLTIYNNENTNTLRNIMLSVNGMYPLSSEWWHFNMSRPNNNYGKGQVTYTNLFNFTATVNRENISGNRIKVTITANRPIKTKPSGWNYVSNINNRKIVKVYNRSNLRSTMIGLEIKDYCNRSKQVVINLK